MTDTPGPGPIIPPDTQAGRAEDADRRLARLASRELALYSGIDQRAAWDIFTRCRALRLGGVSDEEILLRLQTR